MSQGQFHNARSARRLRSPAAARGFTLIEMLVVISIIAMLVALLLPALSGARRMAMNAQCMSNLRQWGVALTAYTNEWDGFYPYRQAAEVDPQGEPAELKLWSADDRPMLENHVVDDLDELRCPFAAAIAPASPPGDSTQGVVVFSYEMWFGQPIIRGDAETRLFRTNDNPRFNKNNFATLMADIDRDATGEGGRYWSAHPDEAGVLDATLQDSGWYWSNYANGMNGVPRGVIGTRNFLQKDGHVASIHDLAVDDPRTKRLPYRNNSPTDSIFGYLPPAR